jgi:hypothetical protein
MALNIGYIELGGGGVTARVYYDTAWLAADPNRNPDGAPLVNGPRGYCLDLTNATGAVATLTVRGISDTPQVIKIGKGDPVTTGPAGGRSRTAAEMAAFGFTTRGNVGAIEISD